MDYWPWVGKLPLIEKMVFIPKTPHEQREQTLFLRRSHCVALDCLGLTM